MVEIGVVLKYTEALSEEDVALIRLKARHGLLSNYEWVHYYNYLQDIDRPPAGLAPVRSILPEQAIRPLPVLPAEAPSEPKSRIVLIICVAIVSALMFLFAIGLASGNPLFAIPLMISASVLLLSLLAMAKNEDDES